MGSADGSLKVGKGETLIYFNEVFDCLNKVSQLLICLASTDLIAINRLGTVKQERL